MIDGAVAPVAVRLDGPAMVQLVYDPEPRRLSLRAPVGAEDLEPSPLSQITIAARVMDEAEWLEIATQDRDLFPYFHGFALSVADRIQLDGLDSNAAVNECVTRWRDLLQQVGRLSPEQELGLLGELWLLCHRIKRRGPADALESWMGPTGAAHDFRFEGVEVEVKATRSEHRAHIISSETQLVASAGCSLYLLSLQFAAAGPGEGWSLAEAIDDARGGLELGQLVQQFDQVLFEGHGLRMADAVTYRARLKLRSGPYLVPVDEAFPRVTPAAYLGTDALGRILDVRYRVNVDGLGWSADSDEFQELLGEVDDVTG